MGFHVDSGRGWHARHFVGVGDHELVLLGYQLAESAAVDAEELHTLPQPRHDLSIDSVGGNADERG